MTAQTSSSSLYVGDLDADVSEAVLFDVFRDVGPVLSIRVCRDSATRKSLGYAYVNFQSPLDAERAIDTMNHTKIKGRMCRIMWCKRDPSLRKSGTGNVFIKNLAKDIDNKALYDTFSTFGPILSSKVVTEEGESKGYGFVHFQDESAADTAVQKVNGMLLNGQLVYVGKFERKDKKLQNLNDTFTNCYVKHFDPNLTEEQLKEYFSQFGKIQSLLTKVNKDGETRGVAFVNYESHEEAKKACETANGTTPEGIVLPGKELVVQRHQKKAERDFNKKLSQKERQQQFLKYTNLYVKNLDDSVNEQVLRDAFSEYGKIMSCKIMTHSDSTTSKGFGFVSFEDQDAAKRATAEMNGRMLSGKPLYVTLAQKKDARRAELEMRYRNGRGIGMMGGNQMMGGMGQMPPFAGGGMMGGFGGFGQPAQGGFPSYQQMQRGPGIPGMGGMGLQRQPMGGIGMGMPQHGMMRGGPARPTNFPMGQQMPGPQRALGGAPMQQRMPPMHMPQRIAPLTLDPARLATMSTEGQKNLLGEKLFEKIEQVEKTNAAKITGMLLEMDNAEILNLLDSPNLLQQKIQEALHVLRTHTAHSGN